MIGEAVADFKGIKIDSPAELKLEIPIDAHIPHTYLDSERLRLEAYHKLSAASGETGTKETLQAILAELEDRYGPSPEQVKNLILVTELRQIANRLGLKDVNLLSNMMRIQPVEMTESIQVKLSRSYQGLKYLQSARILQIPIPAAIDGGTSAGQELIEFTHRVFKDIAAIKKEVEVND
jgi:transcription-repair coupling factor (superfamily II helicase)